MALKLLQGLSVQSTRQWHDIVTLDESWIYLFSEHDLMWTAPGEIVVDRERHTVQSPKFMLMIVWDPIGFHVLKALPKGRKFNAQYYYYIIQIISWSQSQIGGGRPGEHGRTSCECILIMLGHTPRKCQGNIGLNRMKRTLHSPIRQIWHPRTFPFWLRPRKADEISR
jgi:hypothetical protein